MKRILATFLILALTAVFSAVALADGSMSDMSSMGNMTMAATNTGSPNHSMPDAKTVDGLFASTLDGLGFTPDQAMKVHDLLTEMVGPMDALMAQIDRAAGMQKDLKTQEMMLLMQTVQVQVDAAVTPPQALVLDALVFGVHPETAHAGDPALARRLKSADDLRAALDDHTLTILVIDRLAKLMPAMPGMAMPHK